MKMFKPHSVIMCQNVITVLLELLKVDTEMVFLPLYNFVVLISVRSV